MLKYIVHLSDLHIRNGCKLYSRYDEYLSVFENTLSSLKKIITNEYLIVITGDIFHNKNNIGNYGLLLYKQFITELTKIGKVIIIHGNHDKQQSELNQPSLVYSSTFQIDNLIILNESTSFVIDDIGFSYVSVDDTLDYNSNSGRLSVLPEFPKIKETVKYKIALFHGTVSKSKLYNGETIHDDNNPYPLEWVQNFDYVLLGDIHKRQTSIYKNKTHYGYSGSLIQQNFGEDILDHGYLIWDLYNNKTTEVNVYNNIGYINIKQNDKDETLIRINGKYDKLLEDVIKDNLEMFPKCLEIKTFSSFNFENLNTLLNKYNISYSIISRNADQSLIKDYQPIVNTTDNINNVANEEYILSHFNKILPSDKYLLLVNIIRNKETLLLNTTKYPNELHDECNKRNKEINACILSCNKSLEMNNNKSVFLIKYLEWEGLLCYQNKNWINMTELDSKTFMVKGKNGTGKSAIYDIMLLAIWGDNTKMKTKGNTSLSAGMINNKKETAYTIIDIELNGKIYRIERDYSRRKENNLLHVKRSILYEYTSDKDVVLTKKESACNEEIRKLFGTMDDFLTTSLITQNVDNDILKFDSKKCLELIDKSYNIDYIYNLYNLFKLTINKYRDFIRTIENKKQVYQKLVSSNQINDISDDEINDKRNKLKILNDDKTELLTKFSSITVDIRNHVNLTILNTDYEPLIKSLGEFNHDEMKTKKDKFNELKILLKDETDLLKYKLLYTKTIEHELQSINHINKPCELSILQNEEQQLKQYLTIDPKNYKCNDINSLEQQLSIYKTKLSDLEQNHTKLITLKPSMCDNPNITKDECHKNILKYFKTIKEFNKYISEHTKLSNNNIDTNTQLFIKYKSITEHEYIKSNDRYNELQMLLKDESIESLKQKYNKTIEKEFNKLKPINKPCESSILETEEQQLKDYLNDTSSYECSDIRLLEEQLIEYKKQKSDMILKQSELIAIKPQNNTNDTYTKDECLKEILKYYKSLDDLISFIANNKRISVNNNKPIISYDIYIKHISNKNVLEKKLSDNTITLSKLEDDLKDCLTKQQSITSVNKPDKAIAKKKPTVASISKEIYKIDIEQVINNITDYEEKLSYYNDIKKDINNLESSLSSYNQELSIFLNNEDYHYNPECTYCCKRPWVNRIKELEIIINKLQHDIDAKKTEFDENNYNILNKNIENNNNIINNYDLLIQWLNYYKYKEEYDKLNNNINNIITNKQSINKDIIIIQKELDDIYNDINNFNIKSYNLYDTYNYITWQESYNIVTSNINELSRDIDYTVVKLDYNKNIKPRIDKYLTLKKDYDNWFEYNTKLKIIRSNELFELKSIISSYKLFNNIIYDLYDTLNNIDKYMLYKSWEDSYNTSSENINKLLQDVNESSTALEYYKHIKPRIDKYNALKNDYDKWCDYDYKLKIVRSNEFFELKTIIDQYDKYVEYTNNNNLKPLIKEKIELNEIIKNKEKDIKQINDDLVKYSTMNSYNKENKDCYNKLFEISIELNDVIDTLDNIIINFQAFRIELYNKHIINNLISNTNTIIKRLCHTDTKPFKLDYLINVSKDIIHVNWLINDSNIDDSNKIISINQASGFQHFTISLALRMCLFLNKNNLYCNQLFIDEGFVSFDKFNLSIVPTFLKNLLTYFNSIILVSHIDLIQDNIDDFVTIEYDKTKAVSSVEFDKYKKVNKSRPRA